ncbi:hypothetical protein [Shewanella cyperi]|uniref:hypothetical protein n=1 Tax=Shewanella cyperi TaxID=2814292 RepID=UPI001A93D5DE|nr:hypothetical protein [Shewanella cyperi]QSX41696.1 hypothetical protein JYB84_04540 [Shewanella cyperi]
MSKPRLWLSLILPLCCPLSGEATTDAPKPVAQGNSSGFVITGDQELPAVIYLIPWKAADSPFPGIQPPLDVRQPAQLPCRFDVITATADWDCPNRDSP